MVAFVAASAFRILLLIITTKKHGSLERLRENDGELKEGRSTERRRHIQSVCMRGREG
ncbi:hypothetical protein JOQ06_009759, partial [Pogonophryne albipinna]